MTCVSGRNRQSFEHLDEQPGQRQRRPFGIGGDVEQDDLSLSDRLARDQRGVPSVSWAITRSANAGSGWAMTCAETVTSAGICKAEERAVLAEFGQ